MLLNNIPYNFSFTSYVNENIKWISGIQGMLTKNSNDESAESSLIPNASSYDMKLFSSSVLEITIRNSNRIKI